jgi:hypothetical protein
MQYQQDLFFKNLPVAGRKGRFSRLGFLKNLNDSKRLLHNETDICFIWTGTGKIKKLENIVFDNKVKNKIKNNTIKIFLYEPICLLIDKKYNCSFYSEFDSKINYTDIISEELESISIFKKNNDIENVMVYVSDYNPQLLKDLYPDIELCCLDSFLRHGAVTNRRPQLPNHITKKFWCGNWRYTAHRHLVMSYLVHIDGNYSWNLQCTFEDLKKNVWFDIDKLKDSNFERFIKIKNGVDILNKNILRIDTKIDQLVVENSSDVYIPGHNSPPHSKNFLNSYKKCFCAVVNETRYAQPFGYFSEKTLTAINSRLPIILVAPPKTLEYLKKFGFKTFDRWWDESYDDVVGNKERLVKLCETIDYINNFSIEEMREIYKEMTPILKHNVENFAKIEDWYNNRNI